MLRDWWDGLNQAGRIIYPIAAVILVLAVVSATKGGGNKSSSSSGAAATQTSLGRLPTSRTSTVPAPAGPTKAQFIAQADAICASDNKTPATLKKATSPQTSSAAAVALVDQARATELRDDARLKALPVPTGDEAAVAKILKSANTDSLLLGPLASALRAGDRAGEVTAEANLKKAEGFGDGLARAYGLKVCGAGS